MANPKKRRTKSAIGKNRAHLSLDKTVLSVCPKCKETTKPHNACLNCGHYRDKSIVKIKASTSKNK